MAWYADPTAYFAERGTQQTANATEMYNYFAGVGNWDMNAIAAVLGNVAAESTFNPWLWEGQTQRSQATGPYYYRDFDGGYGLVQWTPYPPTPHPNTQPYIDSPVAQLYTGYSPNFRDVSGTPQDGYAQTQFLSYDISDPGNWFPCSISYYDGYFTGIGVDVRDFRQMTVAEFVSGTFPAGTLYHYYGAFMLNYLRPNNQDAANRFWYFFHEAEYWYQYFSGVPPTPPTPTIPTIIQAFMLKKRKKGGFTFV